MVRIASSSMGRGLVLALLIGLGVPAPLEALSQEDAAAGTSQAPPAEGEGSKPTAKEDEPEFELIQTPFGVIRQRKAPTRSAPAQAAPAQVETEAAPPHPARPPRPHPRRPPIRPPPRPRRPPRRPDPTAASASTASTATCWSSSATSPTSSS